MFFRVYTLYVTLYFLLHDLLFDCIRFKNVFVIESLTLANPANHRPKCGYILHNPLNLDHSTRLVQTNGFVHRRSWLSSNFSDYVERNKTNGYWTKEGNLYHILAIETSFDDTCAAIIRSDGKILSEEQLSQRGTLELFQGINPSYAYSIHKERIQDVIHGVLEKSGLSMDQIDQIAVTRGPGLEICLKVGYDMALELSKKFKIDVVDENHIAAHCISPMIRNHQYKFSGDRKLSLSNELRYPYLCLLLSGGHSQIYVVENPIKFHLLSDTQDRYAGNVLDKCARELGLGIHDGGASSLEFAAENATTSEYSFTVPSKNGLFSEFCFSGVQTQLNLLIGRLLREFKLRSVSELPKDIIHKLSYSCQDVVFNQVLLQLDKAMDVCETLFGIKQVALVGGVGCNMKIKDMIVSMFKDRKVMFSTRHHSFLERMYRYLLKFLNKNPAVALCDENDFVNKHIKQIEQLGDLRDLMVYLLNPTLFSSLLTGNNRTKVCTEDKNSIYRLLLYSYFRILGDGAIKLAARLSETIKAGEKTLPSWVFLDELINIEGNHSDLIMHHKRNSNKLREDWELFTPSTKYCRDNAVMIGFNLLEKHRIGIKSVNSEEKIDGKDVLSKWDLGDRKCWEVLSDICKLHSLL